MIYKILGGEQYTEETRPCYWSNEEPLLYKNMKLLSLEKFPLIEDFEIVLESAIDENGISLFGYQVKFFSPILGYIASFPWWDHASCDLAKDEFWFLAEHGGNDFRYGENDYHPDRPISIPLGNFDLPFSALEQSWEIVIAQHDIYVYVMEGILGEQLPKTYKKKYRKKGYKIYHRWFKVYLEQYLEQWQSIKKLVKTTKYYQ